MEKARRDFLMKKEKDKIRWRIVLGIVLIGYNVLAFVLPFQRNSTFVISYIFTMIAILLQVYVIQTAFYKGEGVKSRFYGFPIAKLGVAYLAIQLILGFAFMAIGASLIIPVWIPMAFYIIILAAAVIGLIAAETVRDAVSRQDEKQVRQTSRMREMQAKGKSLAERNTVSDAKKDLEKLAEDLRFSDPVSNESLTETEDKLLGCLKQIEKAVADQNSEQIKLFCREAEQVLAERNRLCRMGKK